MPDELYCYLDIAKGNMFCNAMFLFGQAEEIFGRIICMGWKRMALPSGWHIIFQKSMPCIRSGKATAGARGNSSAAWRCIMDM